MNDDLTDDFISQEARGKRFNLKLYIILNIPPPLMIKLYMRKLVF